MRVHTSVMFRELQARSSYKQDYIVPRRTETLSSRHVARKKNITHPCLPQISPWLRSILLLVSVGADYGRAILITLGGRDISVQLHRKSRHAHQNIAERYVLVHALGAHLHHWLDDA